MGTVGCSARRRPRPVSPSMPGMSRSSSTASVSGSRSSTVLAWSSVPAMPKRAPVNDCPSADALASALGQSFTGARFGMAGTLDQAKTVLDREPETDAVLLDLDMPGMDGLTGLGRLRAEHPTVPIVVVSAARDASTVQRAYEFGASAY